MSQRTPTTDLPEDLLDSRRMGDRATGDLMEDLADDNGERPPVLAADEIEERLSWVDTFARLLRS